MGDSSGSKRLSCQTRGFLYTNQWVATSTSFIHAPQLCWIPCRLVFINSFPRFHCLVKLKKSKEKSCPNTFGILRHSREILLHYCIEVLRSRCFGKRRKKHKMYPASSLKLSNKNILLPNFIKNVESIRLLMWDQYRYLGILLAVVSRNVKLSPTLLQHILAMNKWE